MKHAFWTIFKKEWLILWRDKRSFWMNVIMSLVLFPLLMIAPGFFLTQSAVESLVAPLKVAVNNNASAPSLFTFRQENDYETPIFEEVKDVTLAVQSRQYTAGIILPPDFEARLKDLQPVTIQIITLSGQQMLETNSARITKFLNEYSTMLLQQRLAQNGQPAAFLQTFDTENISVSPQDGSFQRSYLGWTIYIFVVIYLFGLTANKAVDVSSVEKEKQTIEAVLLTPVNRAGMVLGKMAYVATYTTTFVGLTLFSTVVTIIASGAALIFTIARAMPASPLESTSPQPTDETNSLTELLSGLDQQLILTSIGWMFLLLLLLMFLFIAVQMTIGYWARSETQANTILGMGNLALSGISFVILNNNYQPPLWHYGIPFFNNVILFSDLASGNLNPASLALTFGSQLALIFALTALNAWMLNREEIIFRT